MTDSGSPAFSSPQSVARMNIIDSVVFSLFSPLTGFFPNMGFIYLFLNLLLMCAFTLILLRHLGANPLTASLSAIVLTLSPQMGLDVVNHQWNHVMSLALLPVVLYFAHLFMHRRYLLWLTLCAFFFIFQLLRGSAIVSIITVILLCVFALVNGLAKTKRMTDLVLNSSFLVLLLAIGALGAAYVLLPLLEFFRFAEITAPLPRIQFTDLFLFVYPSFNGEWIQADGAAVLYIGVLPLFLAGFVFLLRRTLLTLFFSLIIFGFLVVGFLKFSSLTTHGLPVMFALLSALGVTALIKYQKIPKKRPSRWLDVYMLLSLGAVTAGWIILFFNEPTFGRHILSHMPLLTISRRHEYFQTVLMDSGFVFFLIGSGFLLVNFFLRSRVSRSFFVTMLFLLILADFFRLNLQIHQAIKPLPTEITEDIRRKMHSDDPHFRVFAAGDDPLPDFQSVTGKTTARLKVYAEFLRETGLDLPDSPWMRNPFFSKYTRLVSRGGQVIEQPIPVQNIDPARQRFDCSILDLLNVRYVLCHSPIHDPHYPMRNDEGLFLYENITALPRAFFADSVFVLPSGRATFDAMREVEFEPRNVVYIEKPPPFAVEKAEGNRVRVTSYSPGRLQMQTEVMAATVLVLSEVYYPSGWSARVDGRAVPIYKADSFLRAVFLPAGARSVELNFLPPSFRLGVRISIFVGVLLLAGFAYSLYGYIISKREPKAAK